MMEPGDLVILIISGGTAGWQNNSAPTATGGKHSALFFGSWPEWPFLRESGGADETRPLKAKRRVLHMFAEKLDVARASRRGRANALVHWGNCLRKCHSGHASCLLLATLQKNPLHPKASSI